MQDYVAQAREAMRRYKRAAVNVPDAVAATVPELYDLWSPGDVDYVAGDRRRYGDSLYKCRQTHKSQENFVPDLTPALWELIDVEHEGTIDDPIPAKPNMEYFKDKHYIENGTVYRCSRSTETAIAQLPSELVGIYFEMVSI